MTAVQRVALALHFAGFVLFFALMRIANTVASVLCPPLKRRMDKHMAKRSQMEDSSLAMEDWVDLVDGKNSRLARADFEPSSLTGARIFTSSSFWTIWAGKVNDVLCETRVGGKAPDAPLLYRDGLKQARLLDFAKKGRPLVVNFGSCT
ncbi:Thyroxine 5-deiodinase [Branchiostoma belcheri]|nr:Thyroxine 5-deiodinase [Branchiostoma belcheri]